MLLNLLVIHFAFGSPFGVYRLTRGGKVLSARSAATVFAYFAFWPIVAVGFVGDWLVENLRPANNGLEQQISEIQNEIEDLAFYGNSTEAVFQFREVLARFSGLTMALTQDGSASTTDLRKIMTHKNVMLTSVCLSRRHRRRLAFHQARAKNEFNDFISSFARRSNDQRIAELGKQLTDLLNCGQSKVTKKGGI